MAKFISDDEMAKLEALSPQTPKKAFLSDDEMSSLEANGVSRGESVARGAAQGLSLGFADEISGAAGGMWDDLQRVLAGESGPKATYDEFGRVLNAAELNKNATYSKRRDESREANRKAQEANPVLYGAGEVAGSVATGFVPGLNLAKGATLAARAGQAAALGGASGLGMSEEENLIGMAQDTALGAGLGAGFSVVGEKVLAPALRKAGNLVDRGAKALSQKDGALNKGLSKAAAFASGVDEDAAMRQIQRPRQAVEAEADDFAFMIGQRAVDDTEARGVALGQNVGKAGKEFLKENGDLVFESSQFLPARIDEFLEANKQSKKGFSALAEHEVDQLRALSAKLKLGDTNGEDLFKLREHLDNVEKLASKYDKNGTSPYVRFLKSIRGEADSIIDRFDPDLDKANKQFSQYKTDTSTLRSATNESQSESMISNLFGTNKKAKQEAAGRLFDPATLESAKDIAANKSFDAARKPGGDNYFRRGALAVITTGASEFATAPSVWKAGLRTAGNLQEAVRTNPERFGKYAKVLTDAASRGNQSLAATHFLLSQRDPAYRQQIKAMEDQDDEQ